MNFENLEFSLHDTVALIRLSKPSDHANTLGRSVLRELKTAAASACENRAVQLLMFTGTGRTFSAGADVNQLDASKGGRVAVFLREGQSLLRQVLNLEVITLAAVNGLALGGGLELALACDIRWAHVRAVFGLPEAKLGLLPGWGAISLLERTVPTAIGTEMVLSGEFFSARRAYETGLVSRLFRERDFEAAALAEARKLAEKPPGTLKEIKALMRRQRGKVVLSAGNRLFLQLWNHRQDRRGNLATTAGGENARH